uniref:Ankyrin repeat and SAM domain-containing protein 1A-like n=1 Tax=Phallusia mammillata TaxID=59560 RepID=A0A6F9D5W4_9ASCI|nr:ankyrin repeat and SAM domain-containing protein 1A-like [Phallusia mammillata]
MGKDQELLEAARTGNLAIIERLLSPKAKSTTRTFVASFGIKVGPNVNCQDQSGYTPLHHSALNGHDLVVRNLLQNSASTNVCDVKGNFPLHLAAWSGNADIVRYLLTHGPSVARINEQNGDKETALHCAAQHGHTITVKILLQNAADPLVRNIRDESPLDLASQYGRMDVVRLLLQFQPSLLSRSPECFTPLHLASRNGHKEVVEMLLAHGADINRTGENGSALHEAALFGKREVVKLLLSRGANPHTLDPKNRTAMELVKQLNTQTSREISQLILSFLESGTRNVFDPSAPSIASVPRVTVEEHYLATARTSSEASPPTATESTSKGLGFGGSWGRSSIGKGIMLRRSASARSSKSLPRLPSSRSRSPSGSFLIPDLNNSTPAAQFRQHHPSSNMFPVSPTHSKQWDHIRRSSSSLPSSPHLSLPTSPSRKNDKNANTEAETTSNTTAPPVRKNFTRERLKTEDDVFLPSQSRSSAFSRTRRIHSFDQHVSPLSIGSSKSTESKLAYQATHAQSTTSLVKQASLDSDLGTPSNKSPPGNRPKKPARSTKLSSVMSPPPIPPKPMSMMRSPKVRPPSPDNPPPFHEDEDERESLGSPQVEELLTESRVSGNNDKPTLIDKPEEPAYGNTFFDPCNSLLPPADQSQRDHGSARDQRSPDGSTTPAFSPPSPHTAMIEVSETLQKAVSHESMLDRIADGGLDPWPNMSYADDSSHSVSSYHSSSDDEGDNLKKDQTTDMQLSEQSIALTESSKPDKAMQYAENQDQKVLQEVPAVKEAVLEQKASPPKPAKRMKPPVSAKPVIRSPKPIVTPPKITPRTSISGRLKHGADDTVHDSQSCFVTSGVKVKQARILSTRSSDSQPTSPTHIPEQANVIPRASFDSPDSEPGSKAGKSDELKSESKQCDSSVQDKPGTQSVSHTPTLCSALSALTTTECWPLARSNDQQLDPGRSSGHPEVTQPKGLVGYTLLSRESRGSSENAGADETRSTTDDWDDALSVRTEDFEMPKEVRKFRGLIRGASYRSRSKHRYDSSAVHNKSPCDSDGYGAEFDDDLSEGSASHVTPAIVKDHIPTASTRSHPMTLDGLSKRTGPGNLDLALDTSHYGEARREMRRQYTPGRSDGDDSPLSSSPSSMDDFDGRMIKETSTPRVSQSRLSSRDSKPRYTEHKRHNSFYDNNNNNSANSSKSKSSSEKLESPGDRLPDLATIVDTVTAVRSRSSQGSSSDPASGSSASSTLAKSQLPSVDSKQDENDQDEWAQIASIMSSVGGGLNKGPVYAKEFEETFWKIMTGSELPRQVSTWLAELGLQQYETVLEGNGFDNVDFLAGDILEEQDLIDMDIRDESHRRRLLESAKNLPRLHPLVSPDDPVAPSSVEKWLESLQLVQYEVAFVTKGYDSMKAVRLMTESDFKPLVSKRGHFKRVKASLFGRSKDDKKSGSNRSTRSRTNSQAKASPPLSRSPLLDSANFFKDYTNIVKSRATTLSSTRSADNTSPAFPSGTVSSTGSGSSAASTKQATNDRVPTQGEPAAVESRGRSSNKSPETAKDSTHSRHRHHGRKSSRDSERSKPRSRSGSHSSRTRRTELSVFVEKSSKPKHSRQNSNSSARPSHHRQRSHHKSSSSLRSVDSEQKENLRMSKPSNSTDIPDVERAIYLSTESASGEGLSLRPPNETTSEVSVHAWRHNAEKLITACCNYQAYYLGSMLIHELKGVESTMGACAKMRRSTDSMKKIPTIMLSINYTGVKFIDSKSQHEIAEHEICNISFASQDSEDLSTFAYITHDVRTGHHYCHVFRVTTMDMAYEIILTLGQAFEVAYQLILKDKAIKEREVR